MNFPTNLKYTTDHEWIRFDGETAYVGITDYAQDELGEIVYVDITTLGEDLSCEDPFGTIEAVKAISDLFMPVSGEVLEINPALEEHPEIINESPYEDGWLIKIKPSDMTETTLLLSAAGYQEIIG
ncbi:MAG: glycine cleavage system protein GcvH [Tannerella sp.]|jgi:glycine cleavage system H protein|nr:glycine cleavage system protein GcvH [Tannerella sp.]